jgi:hypothetical protein
MREERKKKKEKRVADATPEVCLCHTPLRDGAEVEKN